MKKLFNGNKILLLCLLSFSFFLVSCDVNVPPEVTITSPDDGAVFTEGETITFTGTATDPEDGEMSGDSLVWNAASGDSGIIELGTGNTVTSSDLAEGSYDVSLKATDSAGLFGFDAIGITVRADTTNN